MKKSLSFLTIIFLSILLFSCSGRSGENILVPTMELESNNLIDTPIPATATPSHQLPNLQPSSFPQIHNAPAITIQNANQIELITRLGIGNIIDSSLSADGQTLAIASGRGTFLVDPNHLSSGYQLNSLYTQSVQWSPDQEFFVTESGDQILIWNNHSYDLRQIIASSRNAHLGIIWLYENNTIAFVDGYNRVQQINPANGTVSFTYSPSIDDYSASPIEAVYCAGRIILASYHSEAETSDLLVWLPYQEAPEYTISGISGQINGLFCSSNNRLTATRGDAPSIYQWDIPTGQMLAQNSYPETTDAPIYQWMAVEYEAGLVYQIAPDEFVVLDQDLQEINRLSLDFNLPLDEILYLSEINSLLLIEENGLTHYADMDSGEIINSPEQMANLFFSAEAGVENQFYAAAGGSLHLFSGDTQYLSTSEIVDDFIRDISFSPDGNYLAVSNPYGLISILDAQTWQPLFSSINQAVSRTQENIFTAPIAWSPSSSQVAVGTLDGSIQIFTVSPDGLELRLEIPPQQSDHDSPIRYNTLAWSPDNNFLAGGNQIGEVWIWNIQYGNIVEVFPLYESSVYHLLWSPDSQTLLATGNDQEYQTELLYSINITDNTLEQLISLEWAYQIREAEWSLDGTLLAVGYNDITNGHGQIAIYSTENFEHLITLDAHNSTIYSLFWTRDGRRLISSSRDGTTAVWGLNP